MVECLCPPFETLGSIPNILKTKKHHLFLLLLTRPNKMSLRTICHLPVFLSLFLINGTIVAGTQSLLETPDRLILSRDWMD